MENERVLGVTVVDIEDDSVNGRIVLMTGANDVVVDVLSTGLWNTPLEWVLTDVEIVGQRIDEVIRSIKSSRYDGFTATRFDEASSE